MQTAAVIFSSQDRKVAKLISWSDAGGTDIIHDVDLLLLTEKHNLYNQLSMGDREILMFDWFLLRPIPFQILFSVSNSFTGKSIKRLNFESVALAFTAR